MAARISTLPGFTVTIAESGDASRADCGLLRPWF